MRRKGGEGSWVELRLCTQAMTAMSQCRPCRPMDGVGLGEVAWGRAYMHRWTDIGLAGMSKCRGCQIGGPRVKAWTDDVRSAVQCSAWVGHRCPPPAPGSPTPWLVPARALPPRPFARMPAARPLAAAGGPGFGGAGPHALPAAPCGQPGPAGHGGGLGGAGRSGRGGRRLLPAAAGRERPAGGCAGKGRAEIAVRRCTRYYLMLNRYCLDKKQRV